MVLVQWISGLAKIIVTDPPTAEPPGRSRRRVVVLGSTGSIGTNAPHVLLGRIDFAVGL